MDVGIRGVLDDLGKLPSRLQFSGPFLFFLPRQGGDAVGAECRAAISGGHRNLPANHLFAQLKAAVGGRCAMGGELAPRLPACLVIEPAGLFLGQPLVGQAALIKRLGDLVSSHHYASFLLAFKSNQAMPSRSVWLASYHAS